MIVVEFFCEIETEHSRPKVAEVANIREFFIQRVEDAFVPLKVDFRIEAKRHLLPKRVYII